MKKTEDYTKYVAGDKDYQSITHFIYDAALRKKVFIGSSYKSSEESEKALKDLNILRKALRLPQRKNCIKEPQYDAEVVKKLQQVRFDELDYFTYWLFFYGGSNIIATIAIQCCKLLLTPAEPDSVENSGDIQAVNAKEDSKGKGKLEEKTEGAKQRNGLVDIEDLFNADQAKNNDLSSSGEPSELEQL